MCFVISSIVECVRNSDDVSDFLCVKVWNLNPFITENRGLVLMLFYCVSAAYILLHIYVFDSSEKLCIA